MRVLYSADEDARGEIAIAATREEWQGVLIQMNASEGYWTSGAIDLENHLNAFGVED